MPTTGTQKFFVSTSPFDNFNIANTNAAGFDATDRERLFFHYNPVAGKVTLDPQGNAYGRTNMLGGNYSFDTRGDYLNEPGWLGGSPNQPIRPGASGLEQSLGAATGAGGAVYNDNLRIGLPRVNVGTDSSGTIQCPYGFYQYNNVCVPGVNMDPTNPANILGINNGAGSFQQPKGVITRVIPPVKTELGQLFQIVTEIQNIGQKPGKFFTKISVPALSLIDVVSNSALVASGQKAVLYQSLKMPEAVAADMLMQVKSDLYKQFLTAPDATPQYEDTNTAQIPNPSTVLGMPPIQPPIPNFPISSGQNGAGYPYSSQPPPVYGQYPWPYPPSWGLPPGPGPIYRSYAAKDRIGLPPGLQDRPLPPGLGGPMPTHPIHPMQAMAPPHPNHSNSPFAVRPFGHPQRDNLNRQRPWHRAFATRDMTEEEQVAEEQQMPSKPHLMIAPETMDMAYDGGEIITIHPMGFEPGEPVNIQFYSTVTSMGVTKMQKKLGAKTVDTDEEGNTTPLRIQVPNKKGKKIAIVAIGTTTDMKATEKIDVT